MVPVSPDIAVLRLGVEAQAASVAEAQSQAIEAMDKVMTSLIDGGVAEKDIQTRYFSIRQVTKWDNNRDEQVVIGYRVTNEVVAKIREIDETASVIDAVVAAGGDLTRIDSISFSVDDSSDYYDEAREEAMTNAKDKAEQLAKLAGGTLGKATYISEGASYQSSVYRLDMNEAAGAPASETPISPGEIEISLTIQVAYNLLY